MNKKLIMLCDFGLDDAVAAEHIFYNNALFNSIDIIAVGGNVSAETSLHNAVKLVTGSPIPAGRVKLISTLNVKQEFAVLPEVHGGDGMGDLMFACKMYMPMIMLFEDYVKSLKKDDKYTVLSLGPLTVTKELLKYLENPEVIVMAGVVSEAPNFNGMEFNQALDEKSYNDTVASGAKVATLDTCRKPQFNLAELGDLNGGTGGRDIFKALVSRAVELAVKRHSDNAYIYDFIASLYLFYPEKFSVSEKEDKWGNKVREIELTDKSFSLSEYVKSVKYTDKRV